MSPVLRLGLVLGWICTACAGEPGVSAPQSLTVEVGIPDVTRRRFTPLDPDGTVYFSKGAQVQEFIMLAVRARDSQPEAFVEVTVTRESTGDQVTYRNEADPVPWSCDDDGWCARVPILLPASSLGDLGDLDGAPISIEASVQLEDGAEGRASASGVLRFL